MMVWASYGTILLNKLYQDKTVMGLLFRPDGGTIFGTRSRESELEAFT